MQSVTMPHQTSKDVAEQFSFNGSLYQNNAYYMPINLSSIRKQCFIRKHQIICKQRID